MTLIEELRESKEGPVVALSEFLRVYFKGSDKMYCFVEAIEDEVYYGAVLRKLLSDRYEIFGCGGKDGVLKMRKKLKSRREIKSVRFGYFVDRDFDKPLKKRSIYETPYYSVESFYCSELFIRDLLTGVFRMKLNSTDYEKVMTVFQDLRNVFHDRMLMMNAYLACYAKLRRKRRNSGRSMPRLKIDNKVKLPADIINLHLDTVICPDHKFQDIVDLFQTGDLINKKKVDRMADKYSTQRKFQIFRGKFEIAFVISFFKSLKKNIENPSNLFCVSQYTTPVLFKNEDFITVTNAWAEVPPGLRQYIERRASAA